MRSRPSPGAALAIAALTVFTVWITWRAKVLERGLAIGTVRPAALLNKPAPDISLQSLDGRVVSLADYRGRQTVVVTFWASWCGPCRMEAPVLRSFYQKTHKPGSDYEILAVSIDDGRAAAEQFATEARMPYPVLLDPQQKAAKAYDVEAIPILFVIDKSGKVVDAHAGFDSGVEFELARELRIKDYNPMSGAPNAGGH
jgi:cytochrome c biogenesis protein CcmG/thiol:disulfide interchange protein DsbE